MIVVNARLLKTQEDNNGFIYYIFENLNSNDWSNKLFLVTRYPNWEWAFPKEGDIGFLVITEMLEGNDYFNTKTQTIEKIQQSHFRFEKFLDNPNIEDKTYKL